MSGICRVLHTFIIENDGLVATYFPHVLQALKLHAASLRNLQLTFGTEQYYYEYAPDPRSGLDFAAFGALEHLKITVSQLIAVPKPRKQLFGKKELAKIRYKLPGSLRILTLTVDFHTLSQKGIGLLKFVPIRMMQEKATTWPHLERIYIFTHPPGEV
jgi:hypothetical protein